MRSAILTALVVTAVLPAAAQDRFSLGLDALPLEPATVLPLDTGDSQGLELEVAAESREALVYRSALTPKSPREFTLALWNAPMGRLYYSRAEAEAMLGREGLVHGGRIEGGDLLRDLGVGRGAGRGVRHRRPEAGARPPRRRDRLRR